MDMSDWLVVAACPSVNTLFNFLVKMKDVSAVVGTRTILFVTLNVSHDTILLVTGTSVPFTSCLQHQDEFSGFLIGPGHKISLAKIATLILMAHDYL